jgi:hypothetical protein
MNLSLGEQELVPFLEDRFHTNWSQLYMISLGQDTIFDKTKWGWPLNKNRVRGELRKGPLVVLMAQDPFNDHEKDTAEQLLKITDKFLILSGNGKYFSNPTKHICYFPYAFLEQKLKFSMYNTILPASADSRRYAISSLGGKSRYHRISDYVKLREKPYFDKLLVTMNNNFDLEECKLETQIEFWNDDIVEKFQSLLLTEELKRGHYQDHTIMHPAYTDSYINYVTETSIRTTEIFCSEKTFKPFMSGQFGVWLSNPGHVEFLRAIGFDVFDDVFGGHAYDREPDLNRRIDQIHDLFDNIMSMDLTSIYQSTLARRQANIDWFYSNDLETLVTAQCEDYQL